MTMAIGYVALRLDEMGKNPIVIGEREDDLSK